MQMGTPSHSRGEVAPLTLTVNTPGIQRDCASAVGRFDVLCTHALATWVLKTKTGKPFTMLPPDSEDLSPDVTEPCDGISQNQL